MLPPCLIITLQWLVFNWGNKLSKNLRLRLNFPFRTARPLGLNESFLYLTGFVWRKRQWNVLSCYLFIFRIKKEKPFSNRPNLFVTSWLLYKAELPHPISMHLHKFSALYCVFEELTLDTQTKISSSKMKYNTENACGNGMCKHTYFQSFRSRE